MNDYVTVAGRTEAGDLILHVPPDFEDSVLGLIEGEAYQ